MIHPVDASGDVMRLRAPAKINLRLRILARETTGYHQLETIFCAIDLADALELRPADRGIDLVVEGAELGPPEGNLVHRAARAFFDVAGIEPAVAIRLEKRIPAGAGLGGGSSDAAAALVGLNRLFGDPLDSDTIRRLGADLGSDVPFFLCGSPLALAWGRGERLYALPGLPQAPALVVVPPFGISTAEAYAALADRRAAAHSTPQPVVLSPDSVGGWTGIAEISGNDFEAPTFERYPGLREARNALLDAGAIVAHLSGSGSALFGVFPDVEARDAAVALLRDRAPELRTIPTKTL